MPLLGLHATLPLAMLSLDIPYVEGQGDLVSRLIMRNSDLLHGFLGQQLQNLKLQREAVRNLIKGPHGRIGMIG